MVIKTSLIDWIGEFEGGVAAFIGLTVDDRITLESVYWVHPDGRRELEIELDFLSHFNVKTSSELPFINELCFDIESILPPRAEMFETFLNVST